MTTDIFSTIFIVEKIKGLFRTTTGFFIYTAVTTIGGIFVLLLFLSMLLPPAGLVFSLPIILAFNGAIGGYEIADRRTFPYQGIGRLALVVLLCITGCSAIVLFCPWEPLFDSTRYLVSGLATLFSATFGAWIAKKNYVLKNNIDQ